MPQESCANCYYRQARRPLKPGLDELHYECHVSAPTRDELSYMAVWPIIRAPIDQEWCGCWKPDNATYPQWEAEQIAAGESLYRKIRGESKE